ncbi:MAG: rhomboid family intramembrane serine protease [Lachnospiraceae bacterium]|nr:rhomboid family intramembrane serine protease [Lachnospiraceae bacterium]
MNLIKKYPVVTMLTVICLLFAIATQINSGMYDMFSFHSIPKHFWQYFSGAFMHGSEIAPAWFLWVHLIMNFLMIIPFGILLEKNKGSKITFWVFFVALIMCSVAFQILLHGKDEVATGISAIGYAFVTGGVAQICRLWKCYSVKSRIIYILLCLLAVIMLLPMITGWVSTCLHISGIISYFIVHIIAERAHIKRD